MKKILIIGQYHHKNLFFLKQFIKNNIFFTEVNNIDDADIILSANVYFNTEKYPNKYFIFGPHFSVFPNTSVNNMKNTYNNACYIQPSAPSKNTWENEFHYKLLPIYAIPFGVDTDKFKPDNIAKTEVLLYYKNRDPAELKFVQDFLKNQNIKYKLFNYMDKYQENDYIQYLKRSKYGIWVGSHESQGFALEEALSCNVPLLVWNVTLRKQAWKERNVYKNIKSHVTTVPYWDDTCGEVFYNKDELIPTFTRFIKNLNNYKPREFVQNNLSIQHLTNVWNTFIYKYFDESLANTGTETHQVVE